MWKLKSLSLPEGCPASGTLLRREALALGLEATAIIRQAHQQAQAIREQARAEAQAEKEASQREWEALFWQQAQTLLTDWQHQRTAEEAQLVVLAGKVVNEALQQLLDEVDDERRFQVLIRQLLRHSPRQQQATLYCASGQVQQIADWLATQPSLRWTLYADPALEPDRLRLITDTGELVVDWRTLHQQLAPALAEESA
ncbi:type III secretion system stator protein SctL [Enterobacteriaceae bacterium EKM102V]|uniref:type III secretion system stator protein SctL n=1 Tax=Pantoea TaxID=53335 RepID=UPI00142DF6E8|nr:MULTISPECIES: type III secretion system stator protein SctL [Pantoea]KAF6662715.1 type III secretion system stator protein SctL [Enterobacteriaceae bacterium EKM102V]KAF6671181.1 type III secretion system stator protein SctL [Pantoea sp. EKM103V]